MRFPNEVLSAFLCTERIVFAKASAQCCEDGDSLMAALKLSFEILSKMHLFFKFKLFSIEIWFCFIQNAKCIRDARHLCVFLRGKTRFG